MITTTERLAFRYADLEREIERSHSSDAELGIASDKLSHCATEIARAPVEKLSDVRIKASLLDKRLRENLSPECSSEVIDHLLAGAVAEGLAALERHGV